jgi:hypothetical protein
MVSNESNDIAQGSVNENEPIIIEEEYKEEE